MKDAFLGLISPTVAVALIASVAAVMTARAALVDIALKRRLETAQRFTELAAIATNKSGHVGYYEQVAAMELLATFGRSEPHLRQAAVTVLKQMQELKATVPQQSVMNLGRAATEALGSIPGHALSSKQQHWWNRLYEQVRDAPDRLIRWTVRLGFVVAGVATLAALAAIFWGTTPDFLVLSGLAVFSWWAAFAYRLSERAGRQGIGGKLSLISLLTGSFLALWSHFGDIGRTFPEPTTFQASMWLAGVLAAVIGMELVRQQSPARRS